MKILLSGGGTAGHITPLLAVAEELLSIDTQAEILFMGQKGDKNIATVKDSGLIRQIYTIRAGKFRRFHNLSLWQNITNFKVNALNLRDFFLVVIGFVQSIYLLIKLRPNVIFFKGGFVVVPIGFAARVLRIPYMTHDSDPIPGMANKMIAKGAKKNAIGINAQSGYAPDKIIVTGIPLQNEYYQRRTADQKAFKEKLDFPKDCTLLFVFTGTQGSKVIDDALESALPNLLETFPRLHVAYVFGRLNEHTISNRFATLKKHQSDRLRILTFVTNAFDYIAAADIIVARAGATSLAEIATIGRASIVIPAVQLTGGHQLLNAKQFKDKNAALIVDEVDLPDALTDAISKLIENEALRNELARNILDLAPDNAAKVIAAELWAIAGREGAE